MALDKEKLLQYYQTHYMSRMEVLFKLPLSFSIDTFWPELLKRRKANATMLPLSDAKGRPYWFVLTDRMIAASEKLCEEALCHEEVFDPYRKPRTGAIMEEVFFTSFVEGAPIQLQEAMDFIQRGTEPENVNEQMIWNNREAYTELLQSIFKPLDEDRVKNLAYTLTEGMENFAEDYRDIDDHRIVAMESETYEVPSAHIIPDRMKEYYDFLAQPDVHPLIKAAVGQAYLLVARPFPEGNERLSRMISFAVLMRSGYEFFRDISISGMIARESYAYYKAMCEILRPENGGDLTYFVEYFLDLLARALEAKKDRDRKRDEDAIAAERKMGKTPLKKEAEVIAFAQAESVIAKAETQTEPVIAKAETIMAEAETQTEPVTAFAQTQAVTAEAEAQTEPVIAKAPVPELYIDGNGTVNSEIAGGPPGFEAALRRLPKLLNRTPEDVVPRLRKMMALSLTSFTVSQWAKANELNSPCAAYDCQYFYHCGILTRKRINRDAYLYRIDFDQNPACKEEDADTEVLTKNIARISDNDDYPQKLKEFLLDKIKKKEFTFSWDNVVDALPMFSTSYRQRLIRIAINTGMVIRLDHRNGSHNVYRINFSEKAEIRTDHLTQKQKNILRELYDVFGMERFKIGDIGEAFGTRYSAIEYHIINFVACGILSKKIQKCAYYAFNVDPYSIFEYNEEDTTPVRAIG